ncbi:MAG: hypothetical protein R3A80_09895 [Bdellovibrionota bacterium]
MLQEVFAALEEWANERSLKYRNEGLMPLGHCLIQVVGQTALLEAKLDIHLAATADVDVHQQIEHVFRKKLEELLQEKGKFLDPVGHEAWMPDETKYKTIFKGRYVEGAIAEPEYVLISKALKAPKRNKELLIDYLASNPSDLFYALAKKYKISLEEFLK